jgi:hypothetical protein
MDEFLDQMIATAYEFIESAKKMMESCRLKDKKHHSDSRLVISFYIKRAVELSESFLILLKDNRLADSAVLLRSFWEMGINTDFIFSDQKKKEVNAIKFLLNEYRGKINILKYNRKEFEATGINVEEELAKITAEYEKMKDFFSIKYKTDDWNWPKIFRRAMDSKSWVIQQAYNQVYAYTCNIEHHDISFGKNYVDVEVCQPFKDIKMVSLLRPDVNLFMCRSILLVIMSTFNEEFSLKWGEVLTGLQQKQDREYNEMKKANNI